MIAICQVANGVMLSYVMRFDCGIYEMSVLNQKVDFAYLLMIFKLFWAFLGISFLKYRLSLCFFENRYLAFE